jgi:hypothetical protein
MFSLFVRSQLAVSAAVIPNSELPLEEFSKRKPVILYQYCKERTLKN